MVVADKKLKVSTSQVVARSIMGRNFLGPEEVQKAFGVKYSSGDRAKLVQIPFDVNMLRACADTHILVAGFPMSMNDIRKNKRVKSNATSLFCDVVGERLYDEQRFANTSVECRWFLLRRKPIDNSTFKTYVEQLRLILDREENPEARDVVFATIALCLTTGEWLFESIYVRCKNMHSHGGRVSVGVSEGGIRIHYDWDHYRNDFLAICSSRSSN